MTNYDVLPFRRKRITTEKFMKQLYPKRYNNEEEYWEFIDDIDSQATEVMSLLFPCGDDHTFAKEIDFEKLRELMIKLYDDIVDLAESKQYY